MPTPATSVEPPVARKAPILSVLFIDTNGSMVSWRRAEIQANPEGFKAFAAAERERGIKPLVMRAGTSEAA